MKVLFITITLQFIFASIVIPAIKAHGCICPTDKADYIVAGMRARHNASDTDKPFFLVRVFSMAFIVVGTNENTTSFLWSSWIIPLEGNLFSKIAHNTI